MDIDAQVEEMKTALVSKMALVPNSTLLRSLSTILAWGVEAGLVLSSRAVANPIVYVRDEHLGAVVASKRSLSLGWNIAGD